MLHVCLVSLLILSPGEDNKELWRAHDACELVKGYKGPPLPTLIDTGSADNFLQVQVRMHRRDTRHILPSPCHQVPANIAELHPYAFRTDVLHPAVHAL